MKSVENIDRKVALCTGPPGNGRDVYANSVVNLAKSRGRIIEKFSVSDSILEMARKRGYKPAPESLVDLSFYNPSLMNELRDNAMKEIAEVIQDSASNYIICTPSILESNGLMNAFERSHLELLRPDFIVVVVDDILRVKERLRNDPNRKGREYSLETIAQHRVEAIDRVWKMAHDFSPPIPCHIIALEHDPTVLFDLIFTSKPKAYLSFAITGETEDSLSTVFDFARRISEWYIVFNPMTLYDWNVVSTWKKLVDEASETGQPIKEKFEATIRYRDGAQTYVCDSAEIRRIVATVRKQIVSRDHKMISAADVVVVYHPRKDISAGVMCEMVHGRREVKGVYAYYPYEPSPWFEEYANEVLDNESDFLEFLRRKGNKTKLATT